MASTNKCLAQSNKSRTDGNATKKRKNLPVGRAIRALAKLANGKTHYGSALPAPHHRIIMRVKFEATDDTGKIHKRSSMSHIYSHCVVIRFAAHPPSKLWPEGIAALQPR